MQRLRRPPATLHLLAALVAAGSCLLAQAATSEEAARLKTTLTPLGAERAGNRDGSIPAWDGKPVAPDAVAVGKPLFSVDAKNAAQHAARLTPGVQALMNRHPSFRIDVYPTVRSGIAPDWVYENTFRNATRAKTDAEGTRIEGAYGGIPFPIPKNGAEAMWNHLLRWEGVEYRYQVRNFVVQRDGRRALSGGGTQYQQNSYYLPNGSSDAFYKPGANFYTQLIALVTEPPTAVDDNGLIKDSINMVETGTQAWTYLSGQRRVRKAPEFAYDTPVSSTSGVEVFDEVYLFRGGLDRYDWKLVGKQEMYVPYNTNSALAAPPEKLFGVGHLNPELVRWELHRVWVVEATLKAGKRHVISKRRLYLDEDTWAAVLYEGYDAQGQLWKVSHSLPQLDARMPGQAFRSRASFDLLSGRWFAGYGLNVEHAPPRPASFYSTANLIDLSQR